MEAIGAIASIIGIAGAGAKLSIVLFEFASAVGSAGQEVRQIAIKISLFCSVLKQLQSTLAKAKAFRYSLSAIETTQEILDRCQEVFNEIERIVNSLRKRGGERSPEATQDWIVRVKWTFKRSQVQLLRSTLESCKVTLHIMLSTLDFAQKIATRRISTIETQAEDEHDAIMTRSLIIAHQCTVDTLQRLEDEEVQQLPTDSDPRSRPLTPGLSSISRAMRSPAGHKPSPSFDKRKFRSPLYAGDSNRKRASVWINELIFDNSPLPGGFRRQTWGDAAGDLFLDQQRYHFLQKWTDQGEHLTTTAQERGLVSFGTAYPDTVETDADVGCEKDVSNSLQGLASDSEVKEQEDPSSNAHTTATFRPHKFGVDWLPKTSISQWTAEESAEFVSSLGLRQYKDRFVEEEIVGEALVALLHQDLREIGVMNFEDRKTILDSVYDIKIKQEIPIESWHYIPFSAIPNGLFSQEMSSLISLSKRQADSKDQLSGAKAEPSSSTKEKSSGSVETLQSWRSWRVTMNDPCYSVLPEALKSYKIDAPWEQYAIYVVYGDVERRLGLDEKPLPIFQKLSIEGKRPMFMLRKILKGVEDTKSLPQRVHKYDPPGGVL